MEVDLSDSARAVFGGSTREFDKQRNRNFHDRSRVTPYVAAHWQQDTPIAHRRHSAARAKGWVITSR